MQTPNDSELVRLSLKDSENFGLIVERYQAKLLRYIRRFSGVSLECAEDILQETFLKAYRYLNDFDQALSLGNWIYRIAHNESVNYLRKNRQSFISLDMPDEDGKVLADILATDFDLAEHVSKRDLSQKTRQILKSLSPDFREVIVLRYLEEKSYQEISEILKKPEGTVSTLLNRAKAQFKILAEKNHLII